MELDPRVKMALFQIHFIQRYEKLSNLFDATKTPDDQRLEHLDLETTMDCITELGYVASFDGKEKFFKTKDEQIRQYKFRMHIALHWGMVELIWVVRENKDYILGDPLGVFSRLMVDPDYRIKKPIFGEYEDLDEIFRISFKMFEDFKEALVNIDELYQVKIDISKLNVKYKCVLFLMLAEEILDCISDEEKCAFAKSALQNCWEWLDTGAHSADSLLRFTGDEDTGLYNDEITEKEPVAKAAINFVLNAVSYVAREAFVSEGVQEIPRFAAAVTDTIFPYALDRFAVCRKDADEYISNVYKICLEERAICDYYQIARKF